MKSKVDMEGLIWAEDLSPVEWDHHLASIGGHPLQSALWGDARGEVDGIEDHRWAAFAGNELVWMGRFEVRRIGRVGRVAWLPKCRATIHPGTEAVHAEFLLRLRAQGYLICIEDAYGCNLDCCPSGEPCLPKPKTIWIDLRESREKLWGDLHKQWRYGVRAAERAGVVVEQSMAQEDIAGFFALCGEISRKKEFVFSGSEQLLALLLRTSSPDTEARLFLARFEGKIAGGALVLRCGRSIHYFWGVTDRAFARQRPGEAVQWAVMEWALEQGLEIYDLEGIDPVNNPGVCAFKRKMGGKEVVLPGKHAFPLRLTGSVALKVGRWLKKV